MSSNDTFDPKFVPSASLLKVVDLKAAQLADSGSIYSILSSNYASSRKLDYQNSVLFYTLYRRGEDINVIAGKFSETPDLIRRRATEGMAILRTGETTRTVAAIRKGALSMKAVDRATLECDSPSEMLTNLEIMAISDGLSQYQKEGQKGSNAAHFVDKEALYGALQEHCEQKAIPVTASSLVAAIPVFAESLGIERRQRNTEPPTTGHMGLEAGLKKVMEDVTAIVAACDGEPYVPTEQDLMAVLQFVEFLGRLVNCPGDESVFRFIMAQLEAANA